MFSVQYGYGPKDMDAAVAEVAAHPKPRPTDIIKASPTLPAPDRIRVNPTLVTEYFPRSEDGGPLGQTSYLAHTLPRSRRSHSASAGSSIGRSFLSTGRSRYGNDSLSEEMQDRHRQYREATEQALQQIQLQVKNREEQRLQRKEAAFAEKLAKLNAERGYVGDIARYLKIRDEAVQRKKAELYKEWEVNVFNDIQRQVQRGLDAQSTREIEKRRNKLQQEYLDITNRKRVVVDVIVENEYDPFKYKNKNIKIRMDKIRDPTRRELDTINEEKKILQSLKIPVGVEPTIRPMLPTEEWSKVRDTLHGRYTLQEVTPEMILAQNRALGAGAGPRPRSELIGPANPKALAGSRSSIVFDHFNIINDNNNNINNNNEGNERKEGGKREARKSKMLRGDDYETTRRVINHELAYIRVNENNHNNNYNYNGNRCTTIPRRGSSAPPFATNTNNTNNTNINSSNTMGSGNYNAT